MRRVLALFLAVILSCSIAVPVFAYDVPSDTIVYVTPTGECYHRYKCSYTSTKTVKSMTISKAVSLGYRACSRCKPNMYTGEYGSSSTTRYQSGSTKPSESSSAKTSNATKTTPSGFVVVGISATVVLCVAMPHIVGKQKEKKRKAAERAEKLRDLRAKYNGKKFEEVFNPPEGLSVGGDGKIFAYGDALSKSVVFASYDGTAYHRENCRYAGKLQMKTWEASMSGRRPCKVCQPPSFNMRWYYDYKKLKEEALRYKIDVVIMSNTIYVMDGAVKK